jgi:REP element-mobilizing transposase RayT
MNPSKPSSVETEEIKREQAEASPAPSTWVPASGPNVERDEAPDRSLDERTPVAPVESLPQISSELSFACVLIPRFSDHYLVGDIVDSLTDWMKQACISYGWRLTMLSIRPGYMQWVMQVPLNANPARFMLVIRRHLSAKIFENFPRFAQKNISGEFWAPGNFVVPADQLQSPEQVNGFMLQTRRMQGIV